jgi:hypothetical protein
VLPLGHLGIGSWLGQRALGEQRGADYRWLLLGTVLPDLVDKPLYYALVAATGKHAAELGLISGTRTLGHTILFGLLASLLLGLRKGGGPARALLVGLATHWLLDLGGGLFDDLLRSLGYGLDEPDPGGPSTWAALFFPLLGLHFPINPAHSLLEHLFSQARLYRIAGELIGALILWRERRQTLAARAAAARSAG